MTTLKQLTVFQTFSEHSNVEQGTKVLLHMIFNLKMSVLLITRSIKLSIMIGYSGAGKPTLLNILRGFYKATSGKVYLGNTCLNEIDPKFFAENDF